MIKRISFIAYRSLRNVDIEFDKINVISGTNGTCKSSILHIISNSFQKYPDKVCQELKLIRNLTQTCNVKLESLTRGDKEFNDPARGISGTLFKVTYNNGIALEFRRHNSKTKKVINAKARYSIKPYYKKRGSERLPFALVIYLGLSRLYPYGEFEFDELIKDIKAVLTQDYMKRLSERYERITGNRLVFEGHKKMGDIKYRLEFKTDAAGVDSNTISAGQDNLSILLLNIALIESFYDTCGKDKDSVLIIDEVDATLHPSYQMMLLGILQELSATTGCQIFFTTHSLFTIEQSIEKKFNIIYLEDPKDTKQLPSPTIPKIRASLQSKSLERLFDIRVRMLVEDDEAKFVLDIVLKYFSETRTEFSTLFNSNYLETISLCLGADQLKRLFRTTFLSGPYSAIGIVDGDTSGDISHCVISLFEKTGKSPEELLFNYAEIQYDNGAFWQSKYAAGFNRNFFLHNIKNKYDDLCKNVEDTKSSGKSTEGALRKDRKALFKEQSKFFEALLKHWLDNDENQVLIDAFYSNLQIVFYKIAEKIGIDKAIWPQK